MTKSRLTLPIDGEDKKKSNRVGTQIEETKFWINRQREEQKLKDDLEAREKKLYGKQDIHRKISFLIVLYRKYVAWSFSGYINTKQKNDG